MRTVKAVAAATLALVALFTVTASIFWLIQFNKWIGLGTAIAAFTLIGANSMRRREPGRHARDTGDDFDYEPSVPPESPRPNLYQSPDGMPADYTRMLSTVRPPVPYKEGGMYRGSNGCVYLYSEGQFYTFSFARPISPAYVQPLGIEFIGTESGQ